MAEEDGFAAFEAVGFDVVFEGLPVLEHFAGDGFGPDVGVLEPWAGGDEGVVGVVDEFLAGFGPFDFLEFGHAVLEFDAFVFELGDEFAFQLVDLFAEDGIGVFEDGFDEGEDVEGVVGCVAIELGDGVQQIDAEGLVHREVVRQFDVEGDFGRAVALVAGDDAEDVSFYEAAEELEGAAAVGFLFGGWFVAIVDEFAECCAAILVGACEDVEEHGVADVEAGGEFFRRGFDEAAVGFLVPVDEAVFGRFAFDEGFFAGGCGFCGEAEVFDDVFGGLCDDGAEGIEAAASGASCDLFEVADGEGFGTRSVVFEEAGEEDGADGDVDADAEGIGAADDLEESALGEFFDEDAVFREESGVVDADAVAEEFRDFLAVGGAEVGIVEEFGDGAFFLFGAEVGAEEVL